MENPTHQRPQPHESRSPRLRHQPAQSRSRPPGNRALPRLRLAGRQSALPCTNLRLSLPMGPRTDARPRRRTHHEQPMGLRPCLPVQPAGPGRAAGAPLLRESRMSSAELNQHELKQQSIVIKMPTEGEAGQIGQNTQPGTAWQRVQNARHKDRPHTLDYIQRILTDFQEIHGDRLFGDDPAIVCGFGKLAGRPVMLIGEQKGRDTRQKLHRNFGMPKPEGYRKALRAMQLAAKFNRPIITLMDTPGAYPGIDAEERGQAEAIARNLREMARLPVPVISVCIGEGGSGGALALGVGNCVFMLENAVYSVISPESCAAIVWRDSAKAELAAAALKLTAADMVKLGLVDDMVPEPPGGAHEDYDESARLLRERLVSTLGELSKRGPDELIESRYEKFRKMGNFFLNA